MSVDSNSPLQQDVQHNTSTKCGGSEHTDRHRSPRQPRTYLTHTCPSYNKLSPLGPGDSSSLALLREFFSRPDDEEGCTDFSRERFTRRPPNSPGHSEMPDQHKSGLKDGSPSMQNRPQLSSSAPPSRPEVLTPKMHRPPSCTMSETNMDRNTQNFSIRRLHPKSELRPPAIPRFRSKSNSTYEGRSQEGEDVSAPVASSSRDVPMMRPVPRPKNLIRKHGGESDTFRCPNCNRRCKSSISYEKHDASCTHRMGPLRLECRFCGRPYTYVGYLSKHEADCQKIDPRERVLWGTRVLHESDSL
ncbi:uncharacterized protein MELLADRAFT_115124 [Melampsora larici-populina 98AG31]|uniref:Uncharacterized protein n=1 Tax=Melampsora larici-populina (strain 98AG31 / pathotype 3-4-7) TaxID=747676 RepID=F4R5J7_MELLP|nr:uncharacterized protein MELLADRAFT_115124 [Melampsora larici-populina 98AG31]EGG12059.1 hypothetical protein MELLADRAFT_115124 [Melampsora larici-populina 98AG31]